MAPPTNKKLYTNGRPHFPRLLIVAVLLLFSVAHCTRGVPPPDAGPLPAEPARDFDRLFQRTGDGWTGGDGTLSVTLPDGRSVWLFGDTRLGSVLPDRTRPTDAPFIRNSLVVQNGAALETRFQSHSGIPGAFFTSPSDREWFWPGDGTVEDHHLRIFLHRFEQQAPRLWAWRWAGTHLATLALPTLTWIDTRPAPSDNEVLYGGCILETEHYTYVYGTQDRIFPKQAHLARTPAGRLQGPWHYFDGREWTDRSQGSAAILEGVSTQYSVIQARDRFYLFTMDGRTPFSNEIVVYRSGRPTGPWQGPQVVYRAPDTGPQVAAYNPFVHVQFAENGRVLVSYNLNHISDPAALYRDADIYRPRFIRVDLAEADRRFDQMRP
ncbi:MAG: DUF5005 domain-containing protein [Desulfobacterales bacterium]